MTTNVYPVELDMEHETVIEFRAQLVKDAQRFPSFLNVSLNARRKKITALFTDPNDALIFRLKWTQ